MPGNALRWILHWFGQGLKFGLFYTVASCCALIAFLPATLLGETADPFAELPLVGQIGLVLGNLVLGALGLAVFTAVLASQLNDWPLRPFVPKPRKSQTEE